MDNWNSLPREVRFGHDLLSLRRGVAGYLSWLGDQSVDCVLIVFRI